MCELPTERSSVRLELICRGHFNQRETPEAREALREEMEDKEKDRAKKAKKEMKEYEDSRKKWAKRLANLKLLSGIVIIGLCESAQFSTYSP